MCHGLWMWKDKNTFVIQVSDDEVEFLTQKSPDDEDAVKSLWHDGLKLLVVTDGEKGCRYYTKASLVTFSFIIFRLLWHYISNVWWKLNLMSVEL